MTESPALLPTTRLAGVACQYYFPDLTELRDLYKYLSAARDNDPSASMCHDFNGMQRIL